jgi:predicted nucleotidyltransferase
VEFDRTAPMGAFEQYFGFKEAVERLIGREVDLVVADAVRNEFFRAELQRTKAPVYVAA